MIVRSAVWLEGYKSYDPCEALPLCRSQEYLEGWMAADKEYDRKYRGDNFG